MKYFLFILFVVQQGTVFAADKVYCNGQRVEFAGDTLYPNGKRVLFAGDYLYPNGKRALFAGDLLYPNGGRMKFAGDELYMSGNRVLFAGDLLYPNKQRVEFAGDCFYQTGVKMDKCPDTVRFREKADGFKITGMLGLNEKKVISRNFEYVDGNVTTYFDLTDDGKILNIDAICD